MCVEINRDKWHKPTYSGHYDSQATHYEGLRTRCYKCEESFVFTPAEQKIEFEQEKRYPGWLPSLCQCCASEWKEIKSKLEGCRTEWESSKDEATCDHEFLDRWLKILKIAHEYKRKGLTSEIRMVHKIINKFS